MDRSMKYCQGYHNKKQPQQKRLNALVKSSDEIWHTKMRFRASFASVNVKWKIHTTARWVFPLPPKSTRVLSAFASGTRYFFLVKSNLWFQVQSDINIVTKTARKRKSERLYYTLVYTHSTCVLFCSVMFSLSVVFCGGRIVGGYKEPFGTRITSLGSTQVSLSLSLCALCVSECKKVPLLKLLQAQHIKDSLSLSVNSREVNLNKLSHEK